MAGKTIFTHLFLSYVYFYVSFPELITILIRWLWTSAALSKEGWVPWDHQVTNAAPAVLLWKKGASTIRVRMPGLYR